MAQVRLSHFPRMFPGMTSSVYTQSCIGFSSFMPHACAVLQCCEASPCRSHLPSTKQTNNSKSYTATGGQCCHLHFQLATAARHCHILLHHSPKLSLWLARCPCDCSGLAFLWMPDLAGLHSKHFWKHRAHFSAGFAVLQVWLVCSQPWLLL